MVRLIATVRTYICCVHVEALIFIFQRCNETSAHVAFDFDATSRAHFKGVQGMVVTIMMVVTAQPSDLCIPSQQVAATIRLAQCN
jgi:hypothetical protein